MSVSTVPHSPLRHLAQQQQLPQLETNSFMLTPSSPCRSPASPSEQSPSTTIRPSYSASSSPSTHPSSSFSSLSGHAQTVEVPHSSIASSAPSHDDDDEEDEQRHSLAVEGEQEEAPRLERVEEDLDLDRDRDQTRLEHTSPLELTSSHSHSPSPSPYLTSTFSRSEPTLSTSSSDHLLVDDGDAPSTTIAYFPTSASVKKAAPNSLGLGGISNLNSINQHLRVEDRLPLTPLEEVSSPHMTLDSPADLAEVQDPFSRISLHEQQPHQLTTPPTSSSSVSSPLARQTSRNAAASLLPSAPPSAATQDETFYHSLLELVKTEDGYTEDLTDLVEVHFSLLAFARFVTDEQRSIIIRDAARLLVVHQRLQSKLSRVEEDLGWIRESDSSTAAAAPGASGSPSGGLRARFKSSDSTVLDAARRISAIFINESADLEDAYRPFCSTHAEAMDIVKSLTASKIEWDAFETQCTSHLALRRSQSTRLHFADFLIKPVQRICRYPLLFNNLLKNAPKAHNGLLRASAEEPAEEDQNGDFARIKEACETFKAVAAGVDEAQRARSLEIATVKLALRMDSSVVETTHLLNHVGKATLIGSGHVIHTRTSNLTSVAMPQPSHVKAAFYGLVLYESHLVMLRAKKTNLYEPKHWLPLRLYDLQVVPDGEGLLPYAIRMIHQDHTFEVGSLCHQEQDIWATAIEKASYARRQQWVKDISDNPVAPAPFDETVICSETFGPTNSLHIDTASPSLAASEFTPPARSAISPDSFSARVESPPVSQCSPATAPSFLPQLPSTFDEPRLVRPKLSLRTPAQRVAVDLRLADLLSDSLMSARALSKRSHAMPLHGPPPRSLLPAKQLSKSPPARPHSMQPTSFSYKSLVDSALPSRRTSLAETDGSIASFGTRPSLRTKFSAPPASAPSSSSAPPVVTVESPTMPGLALPSERSGDGHANGIRKSKLQRSRTSVQLTDLANRPQRSTTLSKIRRRAASLLPEQVPVKLINEFRQQQLQMASEGTYSRDRTDSATANGEPATVARNSSTSSSSSYGSSNATKDSGSNGCQAFDTPQSSLPASPLLTPIDLESQHRWAKLGEAIAHGLTRKKSFASARPILSVPPEAVMEGIQLEQAREAAEYIYTGNGASSSSQASSFSPSHTRRLSWDRLTWGATGSGSTKSSSTTQSGNQSHQYGSAGGRSSSSTSGSAFGADKRQGSSSSLWSLFKGDGHSASPTPSIYESIHEDDDLPGASSGGQVQYTPAYVPNHRSAPSSPPGKTAPLPYTRSHSYGSSGNARSIPSTRRSQTLSPPATPSSGRTGSPGAVKRKNSFSARIRAFRVLGSSMTPLSPSGGSTPIPR